MRFGSENPVFKSAHFERDDSGVSASYLGVTTKITILLGIIAVMAMYTANSLSVETLPTTIFMVLGAMLFGIVPVMLTHRIPNLGFIFAPVYALLEGYVLGAISALYAYSFGGEIIQVALLATFGVFASMLLLYSTGIIRVGSFFKRLMFSVLGGLILANIFIYIMHLTGVTFEAFESFYLVVVLISVVAASLFLLIDFDRITNYVNAGVPKSREWSLGLGIVTTIVWLYLEILRLLAIIGRRN
jgi:uncharacterized YccA/Bax inhibitor family protein